MSRQPIPAEAFDHGDVRRYGRGCRCRPCTTAASAAARRNRYLRQTGRGALISPDRAAAHITRLRVAGMRDVEICAAARTAPDVFYRILQGDRPIRHSTQRRILAVAVSPDAVGGSGARVPGIGTVRRLRALAADGWPAAELGRQAGKHKQFIVYLENSAEDIRVRLWVADYVRDLYVRLHVMTPADAGVPAHIASRARAFAAAKGWAGSDYWDADDFDNPGFEPAIGGEDTRDELAAYRREEIRRLASFGVPEGDIAARLSMAPAYVHDLIVQMTGPAKQAA